jgi:PEGA domain
MAGPFAPDTSARNPRSGGTATDLKVLSETNALLQFPTELTAPLANAPALARIVEQAATAGREPTQFEFVVIPAHFDRRIPLPTGAEQTDQRRRTRVLAAIDLLSTYQSQVVRGARRILSGGVESPKTLGAPLLAWMRAAIWALRTSNANFARMSLWLVADGIEALVSHVIAAERFTRWRTGAIVSLVPLTIAAIVMISSRQEPAQQRGAPPQHAVPPLSGVLSARSLSFVIIDLQTATSGLSRDRSTAKRTAITRATDNERPVPEDAKIPRKERRGQSASKTSIVTNSVTPNVFAGALAVESTPDGAAVIIDRTYIGVSPIRVPQLRAGSHVVWVEHEGYERWTAAVRVTADQQTQVAATLQPERKP